MSVTTAADFPKGCKVTYFPIPALGEPIRLLLELSGEEWTDNRLVFSEWGELKPKTKWGQLPVLQTADGAEMTQTKPLVRFLAAKISVGGAGALYPVTTDPMVAYQADELIEAFEDVRGKLQPTFKIQDQAEKEAARAALFNPEGECTALLAKIEATAVGEGRMVKTSDGSFTVADMWAFFFLNFLRCGFWDGLPTDYLSPYPKLNSVVDAVSAIPAVNKYYVAAAAQDSKYKVFAGEK